MLRLLTVIGLLAPGLAPAQEDWAAIGHFAAVWAAKRDPQFVDVVRRHLRIPGHLSA